MGFGGEGVQAKEFVSHGIPVTQVQVETEQDRRDRTRARGRYITLETGPLTHLVDFEGVCACLVEQLRPLLEPYFGTPLCVCGMGNPDMPSDSLGPETGKRFQPHMYDIFAERSNFEKIAVVCPGTSALTNLATETIFLAWFPQWGPPVWWLWIPAPPKTRKGCVPPSS